MKRYKIRILTSISALTIDSEATSRHKAIYEAYALINDCYNYEDVNIVMVYELDNKHWVLTHVINK